MTSAKKASKGPGAWDATRRISVVTVGGKLRPAPTRIAKEIAGRTGIAQCSMRTLMADPEAAAEQGQAVALERRQQNPGDVEGVVDQSRTERTWEQPAKEEQVECPAVGDERGVPAELGESSRRLCRRRRPRSRRHRSGRPDAEWQAESGSAGRQRSGVRRLDAGRRRSAPPRFRGSGRCVARARWSRGRRRQCGRCATGLWSRAGSAPAEGERVRSHAPSLPGEHCHHAPHHDRGGFSALITLARSQRPPRGRARSGPRRRSRGRRCRAGMRRVQDASVHRSAMRRADHAHRPLRA